MFTEWVYYTVERTSLRMGLCAVKESYLLLLNISSLYEDGLVDPFRYGRRILSLISASGMAITMIGLGIYLEVGDGSSDLSWLPLLLILMYIVSIKQSEGLLSQRSALYKYNTRDAHALVGWSKIFTIFIAFTLILMVTVIKVDFVHLEVCLFVCFWRDSPQWARAFSFTRFLDHTHRRTTVGRIPLDEWSARRRDLYLTTHNTHNRQNSMPPVGFKPTISAGEQPQTYSLDSAATGTGTS